MHFPVEKRLVENSLLMENSNIKKCFARNIEKAHVEEMKFFMNEQPEKCDRQKTEFSSFFFFWNVFIHQSNLNVFKSVCNFPFNN